MSDSAISVGQNQLEVPEGAMEQKNQAIQNSHTTVDLVKPLRCIVKLGGAAITCKNEIETINEENLRIVSSQLRRAMISSSSSAKILGMDWSKRPESSQVPLKVEDFSDLQFLDYSNFIIVHGAGSFGHFQASKSGVHKGGLEKTLIKAGFVATRISVTALNLEIVRALAREGIPSVGMSPFSCGWSTSDRNMESADFSTVAKAIDSGFVPVCFLDFHGFRMGMLCLMKHRAAPY